MLSCVNCQAVYNIANGVPVFLKGGDITLPEPFAKKKSPFKKAFRKIFPSASLTCFVNKEIFNYTNSLREEEVILNLGSGTGRFDRFITHKNIINLDIAPFPGVDIVADAHRMPIKSESVGCVFSNAVFEHVARPWVVAEEVRRVLKKDGVVCVNVPFLNVIHEAYDFYRYTPQGLREIFSGFEEIASGTSSGPGSFVTSVLPEYLSLFVPTAALSSLAKDMATVLCSPLKYLDYMVKGRERYKYIATSFYFVGRKSE